MNKQNWNKKTKNKIGKGGGENGRNHREGREHQAFFLPLRILQKQISEFSCLCKIVLSDTASAIFLTFKRQHFLLILCIMVEAETQMAVHGKSASFSTQGRDHSCNLQIPDMVCVPILVICPVQYMQAPTKHKKPRALRGTCSLCITYAVQHKQPNNAAVFTHPESKPTTSKKQMWKQKESDFSPGNHRYSRKKA